MSPRLVAFFQHMPPYSGAAALRGHSIIRGWVNIPGSHDVTVVCTTSSPSAIDGASVKALDVEEVENSQSLLSRLFGELKVGFSAARSMFGSDSAPLIALVSSPAYLAALVITAWARWKRIPYVLELRDIYPQVYSEAGLLKKRSVIYRFFERTSRSMYRHAELVLVATQGLGRGVLEACPEATVECVYNGFPESLGQRQALKHERFTVCFHGVLGFFQDVETLVELAKRLAAHDVDVLAIGYGRKERLLEEAKSPNLRFLGRLPFSKTVEEIEKCHLGLCLRRDDGISKDAFPVKVWEYLGLGIPSLVTPSCEAGDFLVRHDCGLQFDQGNVEGLMSAILRLKQEPEQLQLLGHNCRRMAAEYTREKTGARAAALAYAALVKPVPR